MSNIHDEGNLNADDIELINKKRMVFIVDECHRSTFGDMLHTVKKTFPRAMFLDLQEHLFLKKTVKITAVLLMFSEMSFTDTVLQMELGIKMFWVLTHI